MIVVDEVAESTSIGERAAEVLDRDAVESTDRGAPLEEEGERSLKEDVWFEGRATWVDVLGGYGVWLRTLEDFDLVFDLLLIQL